MILGKKLYENHGLIKAYLFSFPSLISKVFEYIKKGNAQEHKVRGVPYLVLDEKEKVVCNGCRMCVSACPTNCITIEGPSLSDWSVKSKISNFSLQVAQCILCQQCVEICPFDAIRSSEQNQLVGESQWNWLLELEQMTKRPGINLHLQEAVTSNSDQAQKK